MAGFWLLWHLGLLLQQRHVVQVLLTNHSLLKAIGAEDLLKLSSRRVRIAGQAAHDDLVRRYPPQEFHDDIHILGELVFSLVDCLLRGRF